MALFLGTYNVPTNKKLRVNTTDVTEVYSNGVLVWKYVVQVTPGGLPVAGSKGSWSNTGKSQTFKVDMVTGARTLVNDGTVIGYGEKIGSCSGFTVDFGGYWLSHCQILKWIPAP